MGIQRLKKYILKFTPNKVLKFYQEPVRDKIKEEKKFENLSYSQEGEDLILNRFFGDKKNGFYIDIGAHHPMRFSNTCLFYKKGWSGVNIDAMPGSMNEFEKHRSRDINIEQPIAERRGELSFYIFNESALNTFDSLQAEKYVNNSYMVLENRKLEAIPLKDVLEKYFPEGKEIDFMSIDVEGYDLKVLKSNDWDKYRPLLILVESLENESIDEFQRNEINTYLISKGYLFFAKTINTCFFKYIN